MSEKTKTGGLVVKAKKGMIINRRQNRTVLQGVARREPKWEDMGGGVLRLKGSEAQTAYIGRREKSTKYASMTRREVDVILAPKDAPEVAQAAE